VWSWIACQHRDPLADPVAEFLVAFTISTGLSFQMRHPAGSGASHRESAAVATPMILDAGVGKKG
jgi:hypothetical protein